MLLVTVAGQGVETWPRMEMVSVWVAAFQSRVVWLAPAPPKVTVVVV